jgi:beta-N-acetylhexosaminidase
MFIKVALIFILVLPSVLASSKIDKLMSQMSLEEKAAQLILIGFRGQSVSESESIIFDVAKVKVGSVILFDYDAMLKTRGRNIKNSQQLKKLTHDLQTISSIPLFISIDEEGGLVTRLKKAYGFKTKKSAMELGKGSLKGTYIQARILANELSSHGINLNFAPVVDVNVNPHNPVIGSVKRSFSDDEITNVDDFCDMAVAPFILAPKDEEKLKQWTESMTKSSTKKTKLYLLADAHSKHSMHDFQKWQC